MPNQVKESELIDIIVEAERTPSWMNAQERKLFLVTGNTKINSFRSRRVPVSSILFTAE